MSIPLQGWTVLQEQSWFIWHIISVIAAYQRVFEIR